MQKKELERILFLSRIKVGEKESKTITEDISSILSYIEKLKSVNTDNVFPLFHFTDSKNSVREDSYSDTPEDVRKKMMSMGKDKKSFLEVESIL